MNTEPAGRREGEVMVIAEVAQAHDGSLGTAHALIDAAARAGANAVQFQTHSAEAESMPHEPWRVHFSRQDETRYDYWKRMEFTEAEWVGLRRHADEAGLGYIAAEKVEVPSLYFAKRREVVERDGTLLARSAFNALLDGERWEERTVRFRTIGDATCTGAVESTARSVAEVVAEVAAARVTERGGRQDDRRSEAAMEDRKRADYF